MSFYLCGLRIIVTGWYGADDKGRLASTFVGFVTSEIADVSAIGAWFSRNKCDSGIIARTRSSGVIRSSSSVASASPRLIEFRNLVAVISTISQRSRGLTVWGQFPASAGVRWKRGGYRKSQCARAATVNTTSATHDCSWPSGVPQFGKVVAKSAHANVSCSVGESGRYQQAKVRPLPAALKRWSRDPPKSL